MVWGKINPSGRLADTWQKDSFAAPAANNFQVLNKDGSWNEKSYHLDNYKDGKGYFLHYSEGIYVGYRYFETRSQTDSEYCYEKDIILSSIPKCTIHSHLSNFSLWYVTALDNLLIAATITQFTKIMLLSYAVML